jgi:glycosyltransferase involved in cell wall biosynthesis
MDVSIIIACRNEAHHIREFLDSVLLQEMGEMRWEVIVADGMSTDGTREILREYETLSPRVRVVSNRGLIVSTGLNAAIRIAAGEYIIRMDAHTCYAPDYCARCVAALLATGADNAGGPARTQVEGFKARAIAAAYHSPFSTGGAKFHDPAYRGWVDTVPYGCWRREVFNRIGMFDESMVRNQDDEFNLRLIRSGGRIWQDPDIVSWYCPRAKVSSLCRQYFQYGFWKVFLIRKHRLPGSWRHLVPAAFVFAFVALLATIMVSAIVGAGLAFKASTFLWTALAGTYLAGSLLASIAAARGDGWTLLPILPVVFGAYHFSYGCGFLLALITALRRTRPSAAQDSFYTRISR